MPLIAVFKPCSIDYLTEQWNIEFPVSEWVEAQIGDDLHETNRYDIQYRDPVMQKTISVYLYMSEDSNQVLAIDEVVNDVEENVQYPIEETPFFNLLQDILTKTN